MEKRSQCVLIAQNHFGDEYQKKINVVELSKTGKRLGELRCMTPTPAVHIKAFRNHYPVLPGINQTYQPDHCGGRTDETSHEFPQDSGMKQDINNNIITKPKLHVRNESDCLRRFAIGQSYKESLRKHEGKEIKKLMCRPRTNPTMTDKLTLDPNPSRPSKIPLPTNHDQLPTRGAVYPHPLCYFGGELKKKEAIKPVEKEMDKRCTRIPSPVGVWAVPLSPRKAQNIRSIAYFSEWILKKEIERRIKVEHVEFEVKRNLSILCAQTVPDCRITKISGKSVKVPLPPKSRKNICNNTIRRVQNVRRAV